MCRRMLLFAAITCAFTAFAHADDKSTKKDAKPGEFQLSKDEQALIDLTNAERKKAERQEGLLGELAGGSPQKKELKPLKMNPKLMEAARKHAENMAAQDKLDHILDEKGPADRAKAAGYKSGFIGENVAWNQQSPKDVLAAWMNSEGHRDNILHAEYTEIGVAMVKNKKGEPYWVQVFGKP